MHRWVRKIGFIDHEAPTFAASYILICMDFMVHRFVDGGLKSIKVHISAFWLKNVVAWMNGSNTNATAWHRDGRLRSAQGRV